MSARTAPPSRHTEPACWRCAYRLRRLGSSSYADGKRLYVGLATDPLNYPHGVDPRPSRARTAYRRTCRAPDATSLDTSSAAAFNEADPLFASSPRHPEPQAPAPKSSDRGRPRYRHAATTPLSCSENNYQRRSQEKEGFLPIGYAAYDTVRVAVPLNRWYPAVPSGFTLA